MIFINFKKENLIKSPLNYTGGKYKLLPQILPLFPDKINTFVDLFAGGLDVSLNVEANKIISNDIIVPLIQMYKEFQTNNLEDVINHIEHNIEKYNLSKTNNEGYLQLRSCYNKIKNPLDLMTLISYCYNNQIRFNKSWGFNRAFGMNRHEFNQVMRENLIKMINRLHENTYYFTNKDFAVFEFDGLNVNDFVYADPPYLITYADYSIQALWNEDKENRLLSILDDLDSKNIKFALSNVLIHNGKENEILKNWSKQYNIHKLDYNYHNCNADKKIKKKDTIEVLITNYIH